LLNVKEERDDLEKRYYDLRQALKMYESNGAAGDLNIEQAKQLWESYILMYRRQNASIGHLYGKDLGKSALPQQLESMVQEILDEISGHKENAGAFEQRLNRDMDNVMLKYRQDFPQHAQNQYRFVSLVFAGFKDPTIAAVLGMKTSAISTRRSRLKKQILESNSQYKELYKSFFKNS
jgi:hypothetical protein